MTPRKSQCFFLVVCLAVLGLLLAAPISRASQGQNELGAFHPGGDGIVDPPIGGPSGGGDDGGDPDDYSNLRRAPDGPSLDPVGGIAGERLDVRRTVVWSDPLFHAVLIWMGLER
jgi:hypothetical protein